MKILSPPRRSFQARHRSWHRHSNGPTGWGAWVGEAGPHEERVRGLAGWFMRAVLFATVVIVVALCLK